MEMFFQVTLKKYYEESEVNQVNNDKKKLVTMFCMPLAK